MENNPEPTENKPEFSMPGIQIKTRKKQKLPELEKMEHAEEEDAVSAMDKKPEANEKKVDATIFALRTTANREDQVMSFIASNVERKNMNVYSIIRPHGMRGYIFIEAETQAAAEEAAHGIPYARGVLPKKVEYKEIEHMLEQAKKEINIQKNDICEIISGPFKREKAKITRVDKVKEEVVVELLEAAVPIPITVRIDAVKVIRRDEDDK